MLSVLIFYLIYGLIPNTIMYHAFGAGAARVSFWICLVLSIFPMGFILSKDSKTELAEAKEAKEQPHINPIQVAHTIALMVFIILGYMTWSAQVMSKTAFIIVASIVLIAIDVGYFIYNFSKSNDAKQAFWRIILDGIIVILFVCIMVLIGRFFLKRM